MSQEEQMYQFAQTLVGYDNQQFNLVIDELFALLREIDPDQRISAKTSYSGYVGTITFIVPQSFMHYFQGVTV